MAQWWTIPQTVTPFAKCWQVQEFRLKREVGALATPRVKLIPRFPPHWAWNYARRSSQKFAGKIPNSAAVCLSSSSLSHFAIYASKAFPYVTHQIMVTVKTLLYPAYVCILFPTNNNEIPVLRRSNCLRGLKWPKAKALHGNSTALSKNQCITTPPATRWFNFD